MKRLSNAFTAAQIAAMFAVLSTGMLTACGGGGGGDTGMVDTPAPPGAPPAPGDTFTAALVALVRNAPDDTEPADVEGTMLTTPDGGEPVAVE